MTSQTLQWGMGVHDSKRLWDNSKVAAITNILGSRFMKGR
jgi:hypothetical protein